MTIPWRRLLSAGGLTFALVLALPSHAQEKKIAAPGHPLANPWATKHTASVPPDDGGGDEGTCFSYSGDVRYCTVVKPKHGTCHHNRWGQIHSGLTGPQCNACVDTVDINQDFLVDHYETPLEEGCFPYNDCQTGSVSSCA